jgi:hypothetical protein
MTFDKSGLSLVECQGKIAASGKEPSFNSCKGSMPRVGLNSHEFSA